MMYQVKHEDMEDLRNRVKVRRIEDSRNDYYNNNNHTENPQIARLITRGRRAGLGQGNSVVIEELQRQLDRGMEEDLIEEAIRIAAFAPRPSWAYVRGILRNWNRAGYTTLEEYEEKNLGY